MHYSNETLNQIIEDYRKYKLNLINYIRRIKKRLIYSNILS